MQCLCVRFCLTNIFRDIWNKFLEFESDVGDLASIHKVEKRRKQLLGQVANKMFIFCLTR